MSERKAVKVTIEELEEQKQYLAELKDELSGMNLKYHIVTYGCQMNVHDSEKLAGILTDIGYNETADENEADLILFNTCCVREHAEQRVYGNIGALKSKKQANPNMIIGVCGCMMQQKEVSDYIIKKFPFVDLIFGTHNLHRFPMLLQKAIHSNNTVTEILDVDGDVIENVPVKRQLGVSAWTTIMYGCNNFCSYCIVPYVRGRERSRKPEDILREIQELLQDGYKEITLLGQNVNSYGKDLQNGVLFPQLLRKIDSINDTGRIRFMTSHPKDLSDDLIDALAECKSVCEHLHLPIQSGSNRILKEMNRKYTREEYLMLVEKIRKAVPGIALTTDIIVGFPGETEEDFQDTLDIMETVQYDSAFTFMYSPRIGTPAAKKPNQLLQEEKKARLDRLIKLQAEISKKANKAYKGRRVEVLVEGPSKNKEEILTGRTRTNKIVNFKGDRELIGKFVNVNITVPRSWTLEGELV